MSHQLIQESLEYEGPAIEFDDYIEALHEKTKEPKDREELKKEVRLLAKKDLQKLRGRMEAFRIEVYENEGHRIEEIRKKKALETVTQLEGFFEEAEKESSAVPIPDGAQEPGFLDDPVAWFRRKSEEIGGSMRGMMAGAQEKMSLKSLSGGMGKMFSAIRKALEEMRDGIASFLGTFLEDMKTVPVLGGMIKSVESFVGMDRAKFFSMLSAASISIPLGVASAARGAIDKSLKTFGLGQGWTVEKAYMRFIELLGEKPSAARVQTALKQILEELRKPVVAVTPIPPSPKSDVPSKPKS